MFIIHIQHKHLTLYNSLIIHKVHIRLDSSRIVKLVKIIWRISPSSDWFFNIQANCRFNISSALHLSSIKITSQFASTVSDMRLLLGGRMFTFLCHIRLIPSKYYADAHIQKALILNSINIQVKIMEVVNASIQI